MNVEFLPRISLFIIAWFVMDRVTPILMRLAGRIGAYDVPHDYKQHETPVPFIGGVAIYFAFCAAIFATLRFSSFDENRALFGIIIGGFFVMVFGLLDDLKPIHAVLKLLMIAGVTYLITHFGVMIRLTGNDLIDVALTIVWVAGVTSAMNSLDNWDGVAGGIAGIAAFFTFLVTWHDQPGPHYFGLALMGASMGFLGYNYPPAKLFLGNNGAFVLGFLLASLTVMTGWSSGDRLKAVIVPCAILVVPLYDITLSTILRIVNGRVRGLVAAIIYCGRDHLSHRIARHFGLGKRGVTLVLYGLGTVGGGVGYVVSLPQVGPHEYIPITLLSVLVMIAIGTVLSRARVYDDRPTEVIEKGEPPPDAI